MAWIREKGKCNTGGKPAMANLIMRFPGGLPKALTLSYDDGVEQDEKLIEIEK